LADVAGIGCAPADKTPSDPASCLTISAATDLAAAAGRAGVHAGAGSVCASRLAGQARVAGLVADVVTANTVGGTGRAGRASAGNGLAGLALLALARSSAVAGACAESWVVLVLDGDAHSPGACQARAAAVAPGEASDALVGGCVACRGRACAVLVGRTRDTQAASSAGWSSAPAFAVAVGGAFCASVVQAERVLR
jgi:hypothetical protein